MPPRAQFFFFFQKRDNIFKFGKSNNGFTFSKIGKFNPIESATIIVPTTCVTCTITQAVQSTLDTLLQLNLSTT